jgi:hypothetical protein
MHEYLDYQPPSSDPMGCFLHAAVAIVIIVLAAVFLLGVLAGVVLAGGLSSLI